MFTQMATRTNLLECKDLLYLRRLRSFRWGDFLTNRQHEIDRQLPPHWWPLDTPWRGQYNYKCPLEHNKVRQGVPTWMPARERKPADLRRSRLAYGALAIVHGTAAIARATGLTDVTLFSFLLIWYRTWLTTGRGKSSSHHYIQEIMAEPDEEIPFTYRPKVPLQYEPFSGWAWRYFLSFLLLT